VESKRTLYKNPQGNRIKELFVGELNINCDCCSEKANSKDLARVYKESRKHLMSIAQESTVSKQEELGK
jgi:hypothetical protein